LSEAAVEVGEATYWVVHPAAPDALIDEADFERDERLPYWAELWPSAVALARRLARSVLSDVRAIELGCGVGLPTVAALAGGARVTATDHYRAALDFARYNARLNLAHDREPDTRLLDWRVPMPESFRGAFDLVFAADVLYERGNAEALAALMPSLVSSGGEILVADPGRRWEPLFRKLMLDGGFGFETEETVVGQAAGKRGVNVIVHRIFGGPAAD
jgi:predicted nicotinamide N-methyase